MEELLVNAGLARPQAAAYLYLLENGESRPPVVAKALGLTRSNSYKVLDSLHDLGLVSRLEIKKTFTYRAADPSALASLVAEKRNNVIAMEQDIRQVMGQLRGKYNQTTGSHDISIQKGTEAMKNAYIKQAKMREPIHFIKSRSDIPFLGYENMDNIRRLPSKYRTPRFGITPDAPEAPTVANIDATSNLTRTWVPTGDYTSPVEWTASGDELLIQIFEGNGYVIKMQDSHVAESFRQIWKMIDKNVRACPNYTEFGPRARRAK